MAAKRDLNTHWVQAVIAEPLQSATRLGLKLDIRLQFGNRQTMKFWRHLSPRDNTLAAYPLKGNTTGNLVQWCFF
ncbi:MAG: hypothetical protein MUO62_00775 [Anaerolineales bacterium]|nr:hypothetical protein [Anaerolineales bacterium]